MNIKGLYFKLNVDKEEDNIIYNFFIQESIKRKINKIDLLYKMICMYSDKIYKEDEKV